MICKSCNMPICQICKVCETYDCPLNGVIIPGQEDKDD